MLKSLFRNCCSFGFAASVFCAVLGGCGARIDDTGTETHWLKACDSDAECNGPTSCLCGVCTITCERDNSCPDQAPQCLVHDDDSCSGGGSESICLNAALETLKSDAAPVAAVADASGAETSDAGGSFSNESYFELLCSYYTGCSPTRAAYGTREQCLDYSRGSYEAGLYAPPEFAEPGWDLECLATLGPPECPPDDTYDDVLAVQQRLYAALFACALPEMMGCNDKNDCDGLGECSGTEGSCGTCQRSAPGKCRHDLECSGGEWCVDGVCGGGMPLGSACETPFECQSHRCTDVCVQAQPEGGSCDPVTHCEQYYWCNQGVCASPASPGEPCSEDSITDRIASCQIGYICNEGHCQSLGLRDIALGEPCSYSGSCVAGAECVDLVCVQSDAACIVDQQCPEGQYCDTECLPKRADGEQCDGSSACVSGYCSDDGVCGDGNPCD